jgi:hypothetical protein
MNRSENIVDPWPSKRTCLQPLLVRRLNTSSMSTTTKSSTSYPIVSYRYQQDAPGVLRPSVPREEWKLYPTTTPSGLRLLLETTKEGEEDVGIVLKILNGASVLVSLRPKRDEAAYWVLIVICRRNSTLFTTLVSQLRIKALL